MGEFRGGDKMLLSPKREELKKRREKLNLSMHALSLKAELSSPSIYRIEAGITNRVNPFRAKAIAKALHCKVTDIFEQ